MTINSPKAYLNNIWDWKCLDGCFGNTAVRLSDIDGIVSHASRHFLIIETKSPNVDIPDGQAILFERMVSTGHHTVLLVWGRQNAPERIIAMRENGDVDLYEGANMETLRGLVADWWRQQDEYWRTPNPVRNHLERWRARMARAELREIHEGIGD